MGIATLGTSDMIKTFDIESNGLLYPWDEAEATRIHVIGCNEEDYPEAITFAESVEDGDCLVFHNGIRYDLPLLKKLAGIDFSMEDMTFNGKKVKFYDTWILSKLLNPCRVIPKGFGDWYKEKYPEQRVPGPHSLAAWAYRLKHKGKMFIDDWENLSYEEYKERVLQDTEITRLLFDHLIEEVKEKGLDIKRAYYTEMMCVHYQQLQEEHGVLFDKELAERNVIFLDEEMGKLEAEINPLLPDRTIITKKKYNPPKVKFKKDGEPSANLIKFLVRMQYCPTYRIAKDDWVATPDIQNNPIMSHRTEIYPPIELEDLLPIVVEDSHKEPMTVSNQKDLKNWLMSDLGWVPTMWNVNKKKEPTSPKLHDGPKVCPGLEAIAHKFPVVDKVILWLSYSNRRSIILSKDGKGGLLMNPRLAVDGRISAKADTMGAASYRSTHQIIANFPRPGTTFGTEMRGMVSVPEDKVMVGWDACGLEAGIMAHYVYTMPGGKELADKILAPGFSIHQENMDNWGLEKPICKNGQYALQYNCLLPTFARTIGISEEEAAPHYDDWWDRHMPLRYFVDLMETFWKNEGGKAWVPGIDGRRILTRSAHSIVNYMMQNAGSVVMKRATIFWHREIYRLGLDARRIIDYHDEDQAECSPDIADKVGEIGCWSISEAGRSLGLNVPLEGEYKIGNNWAMTH